MWAIQSTPESGQGVWARPHASDGKWLPALLSLPGSGVSCSRLDQDRLEPRAGPSRHVSHFCGVAEYPKLARLTALQAFSGAYTPTHLEPDAARFFTSSHLSRYDLSSLDSALNSQSHSQSPTPPAWAADFIVSGGGDDASLFMNGPEQEAFARSFVQTQGNMQRWANEFEGGVAASGFQDTFKEQLDARPIYSQAPGRLQPLPSIGSAFTPVEGGSVLERHHNEVAREPPFGVVESEAFAQAFGEAVNGKNHPFALFVLG
jgi:hypothetical protein